MQMFINRWMDEQIAVYSKNEMLIVSKKEWTTASTKQHQWITKKSDTEKYILCVSIYMRSKNKAKLIYIDRNQKVLAFFF